MESRAIIKKEAKTLLKNNLKNVVLVLLIISGITFVLNLIGNIVSSIAFAPTLAIIMKELVSLAGGSSVSEQQIIELMGALMLVSVYIALVGAAFSLVASLITNIFVLPRTGFLLDITEGKEATVGTFLAKKRYWESFKLALLVSVKIFLWSLLFVIPGIIKTFSYAMAPYLKYKNPDKKSNECIQESKRIMKGYKGSLFVLYLSFIGWYILVAIVSGIVGDIPVIGSYLSMIVEFIANLFLTGYILLSVTIFYRELTSPYLYNKYNNIGAPVTEPVIKNETSTENAEVKKEGVDPFDGNKPDPFDRKDDVKVENSQSDNVGNDGEES